MARPKKNPDDVKSATLNIPLTPDEKQLIAEAAIADKEPEFTRWARDTLLAAARKATQSKRPRR